MKPSVFVLFVVTVVLAGSPVGAERHMMQPLVPADKLAEARALKSPLPDSPEIVAKGKALYEGKGACFNCHGTDGGGNGPAAAKLNPAPRDFRHHGFWRHRSEGEIFWTIKHGSPGTAMIAFGPVLSDEEIWSLIQYERTFAGGHGRRGMGRGEGMGPMMGPGGGEHRGRRGGMDE
ncbi:MAG: c-type cytochrome [Nitrospira sp.]|nr:c-type cytochrome [Nitrospira sp.]